MKIEDIILKFVKIPGLTRRNATKMLFHLIRNKGKIPDLIKTLEQIEEEISTCTLCGNIAFGEICEICEI